MTGKKQKTGRHSFFLFFLVFFALFFAAGAFACANYPWCDNRPECDCRTNPVSGCDIISSGAYNLNFNNGFADVCKPGITVSNSDFNGVDLGVGAENFTMDRSIFNEGGIFVNAANATIKNSSLVKGLVYTSYSCPNCNSDNFVFSGNNLNGHGNYGNNGERISVQNGTNTTITDNNFTESGISIGSRNNILVKGNTFFNLPNMNFGNYISVGGIDNIIIEDNNKMDSIAVSNFSGNINNAKILNNAFFDPDFSLREDTFIIKLYNVNNSEVSGNYNNYGAPGGHLSLKGNGNIITRNRFSGINDPRGIKSRVYSSSTDNRFYLNDFNSLEFVEGTPNSSNLFDDGIKNGNHWYNYDAPSERCLDLDKPNEPGIDKCDDPFVVHGDPVMKDRFPKVDGRVDLNTHQTSFNMFGIEPTQVLEGSPLIKGKNTRLRVFVDLLNDMNVVQRDLNLLGVVQGDPNLLGKPITVVGKIGTQEDSTRVYFANWYDYRVNNFNPQTIDKNFTYALPVDHKDIQQIVKDFKFYANQKNYAGLEGVRKLVHDYGIDAVNLFSNTKVASVSDDPTTVSIQIDPDNDLVESNESNNDKSDYFEVRQLIPMVKFTRKIYNIKNYDFAKNPIPFIVDQWDYLIQNFPVPENVPITFEIVDDPCELGQNANDPIKVSNCRAALLDHTILLNFKEGTDTHEIYYFPKTVAFLDSNQMSDALGIGTNVYYLENGIRTFVAGNAFVHENAIYAVSTHEIAHTFGVLEQYDNDPSIMQPEWVKLKERFPFGFMSCGKINYKGNGNISTDTCYGTGNYNLLPTGHMVSVKPYDGNINYDATKKFSPNFYSFMSNGNLTGEQTFNPDTNFWKANYYARWLDPLTRDKLWDALTFRGIRADDFGASSERIAAVSGIIFDENIEILPILVGNGIATTDFNGDFPEIIEIEIQDSNMQTLALQKIMPMFLPIEDQNAWNFVAAVPFPLGASRIIIKRNGITLWEKIVSENTPVVTMNAVNEVENDLFSIDWNASDADNDEMFYSVEYTVDGIDFKPVILSQQYTGGPFDFNAQAYYAGSNSAFLHFTVTDGVNTATADTNTFAVSNKGPLMAIVSPETKAEIDYNSSVRLRGFASDEEDGALPDNAFSWSSNMKGFLGTGETIDANSLKVGKHTITLTVTDSEGLQAEDSIIVKVCEFGIKRRCTW